MDYNTLLLGIITVILSAVAGGSLIYLKKTGKLDLERTSNAINTVEEVFVILKPIVAMLTEDNFKVANAMSVMEDCIDYAQELMYFDELDKLELLRFAYTQCENIGIELGDNEKQIIESAVTIIYMFVKE